MNGRLAEIRMDHGGQEGRDKCRVTGLHPYKCDGCFMLAQFDELYAVVIAHARMLDDMAMRLDAQGQPSAWVRLTAEQLRRAKAPNKVEACGHDPLATEGHGATLGANPKGMTEE